MFLKEFQCIRVVAYISAVLSDSTVKIITLNQVLRTSSVMVKVTIMFSLLLMFTVLTSSLGHAVEFNDSANFLKILRCCRSGEDLKLPSNSANVLSGVEARCVPSSVEFKPLIYSPEDQVFLEKPPKNWRFDELARPRCFEPRELEFVPHTDNNPYILFADGQVLLETGGIFLRPEQYCLGSSSLMACLSRRNDSLVAANTVKPKVRKCCGEKAAYNSERYL